MTSLRSEKMTIPELLLRISLSFITLLFLTRIMGRKELTQMTFFNFVSAIAIGSLTAALAVDSSLSMRNGVLALIGWSIFTIILGMMDLKSKEARKLLEGEPRILIKKGKIMEDELRKVRLDEEALRALLRQKNIFSFSDVDFAIFETNGKLSVLKKETQQPITKKDLNMTPKMSSTSPLATEIIGDGQVIHSNLDKLHLTSKWLDQQLHNAGIQSIEEVFYAEVQKDGSLYIDKRDDQLH